MGNKYYEPGAQRAAKVKDLFATIAPRYDLINDLQSFWLHRLWKGRLVNMASPKPGERALDLCCGTGDVALALARRGADVIGLDFSDAMLAVAGQRLKAQAGSSVQFLRGDAQQTSFPDDTFDIVTISYGLRNLADWREGLGEMWRVAKPGGRLLVLDFGKPDNALWRRLYFGYLKCLVPLFGRIFCGDSQTHAYILESLQEYPAQHGVADQMTAMACANVRIITLLGGVMSINCATKFHAELNRR
jgi:demethylmenaquinone methyltransferase / 2-methoxy-6-polyprenyl-1,4-benzoquinol methylase